MPGVAVTCWDGSDGGKTISGPVEVLVRTATSLSALTACLSRPSLLLHWSMLSFFSVPARKCGCDSCFLYRATHASLLDNRLQCLLLLPL